MKYSLEKPDYHYRIQAPPYPLKKFLVQKTLKAEQKLVNFSIFLW